jgi:hypothetical protein
MILLRDLKGAMRLVLVVICLCMFQLAPVTISTQYRHLCGGCGADKTWVSLRRVAKIRDRFLEQGINIKSRVKMERNVSDTCAMLSEAWGDTL